MAALARVDDSAVRFRKGAACLCVVVRVVDVDVVREGSAARVVVEIGVRADVVVARGCNVFDCVVRGVMVVRELIVLLLLVDVFVVGVLREDDALGRFVTSTEDAF